MKEERVREAQQERDEKNAKEHLDNALRVVSVEVIWRDNLIAVLNDTIREMTYHREKKLAELQDEKNVWMSEAKAQAKTADRLKAQLDALQAKVSEARLLALAAATRSYADDMRSDLGEIVAVLSTNDRINFTADLEELASDYSDGKDFSVGDVVRFIDGLDDGESKELTVVSFKPAGNQTSYMLFDEAKPGADIRSYGTELELIRRR